LGVVTAVRDRFADLGGHGESVLEYDDRARPVRMTRPLVRDEQEQADYIRELLDVYDEGGVDAAFVNTFARRDLPTSSDPDRDFDKASYGIVKILAPGAERFNERRPRVRTIRGSLPLRR
jgi:hypothetical protein